MTALRAFIAIGLAAFWFAMFAPPLFMSPPRAVTGTTLVETGAAIQPNLIRVQPGSPAYRAGLRTGDVLGCLSVRDAALLLHRADAWPVGYTPGTVLSTCVRRNGELRTIPFVAASGPPVPNSYGSIPLSALRVCVVLVFFLTGIALVMAKPSPMTWIFYFYCLFNAPAFAASTVWTILPSWQYATQLALLETGSATAVALLLLFTVIVPNESVPKGWRAPIFWLLLAITLADALQTAVFMLYTGIASAPSFGNTIDEILTALTVLLVIVRLGAMQRAERARFGWAAFAIIFGVLTNDFRNVFSFTPSLVWLSVVAADLTVVMPLCLTYAILKRHVIDVRFVISRTVVYAAMTTLVIGVIGLADWLTSTYLSQARVAMAIDAGVTIVLALILHRTYRRVETAIDFMLFRNKYNSEAYLDRMAKTLQRAKREETIDGALVHAPYEKLDLTMAALFRAQGASFRLAVSAGWDRRDAAFDQEHELVRFLATERTKLHMHDLRAHVTAEFEGHGPAPAVAIPLFQGDELFAFAVYGIHHDGTKLDPDELDTLERLCDTAAQAYVAIELARYRTLARVVPAVEMLQH